MRRRSSVSSVSTQRKEKDTVRFVSGIYEGKSTGAPIAFLIDNVDVILNVANNFLLKPSHASFVLKEKFGHECNEQGGRFSARQTVCRVVAGAVAKLVLKQYEVKVSAETLSVADIQKEGDTAGALVQCRIENMPAGCGEPTYDGFDARLAAAMLSIPACKGFEIGEGFAAANMCGSSFNDCQNNDFSFKSNHDGGVQAGITNGQTIVFRLAFKPIPTLQMIQQTIDYNGNSVEYVGNNRNDITVVPRVLPVVESMAALVALDALLLHNAYKK